MEYKNMRMPELKSLAREHRLRGYSRMRKAELVACFRIVLHQARAMQAHLKLPTPGLLHFCRCLLGDL